MPKAKSQNHKKKRRVEYLESISHRYYIFCEGEQTEPLYFGGFKNAIMSNPAYKNMVQIEVYGIGAETLRVLDAAMESVSRNKVRDAFIWCVFDKDSFPPENFNAVSMRMDELNRAEGNIHNNVTYRAAWSNQCIEYWFILHFDLYQSDNDRKYYREYLHKKFAELGWKYYSKNNKDLFEILTRYGNPKLAIRRAVEQLERFMGVTDAESAPATKVHLLVQELAKYLPEEIKGRYI